jgi:UDP-glucose 4-epimerase
VLQVAAGNGNDYTTMQVVEAAREVTGHPIPVVVAPRRDGDAVITVASSEKAHQDLGRQPGKPDLRDIVADAWAFHTHHH